ncbi:helix-turn-helix domain-containing protein [Sphingobacterium oryzagri]|uniref:Helix-turn-helix domain-containing protein n=1 Tax=Sphingobacterium oryzagri TaxID=3025669 RepID=A0ABY7WDX4_9SPHI|nr:helix-turn-helix domain-containing protein [Sphingobacterium sp. KACC 22765]WDF67080.1 helix-turn-helix domain-containing protein [Sphingobacterium sp. KACC 22765]
MKKNVIDDCDLKYVLDIISDKWSVFVILTLSEKKVVRFNELQKLLKGISQKMLTASLRKLEGNKLVERRVFGEIPPKVEYTLSSIGLSLVPHIKNVVEWAVNNVDEIKSVDHNL